MRKCQEQLYLAISSCALSEEANCLCLAGVVGTYSRLPKTEHFLMNAR